MKLRHVFGKFGVPDKYFVNDGPCGTDREIAKEEYDKLLPPVEQFDGASLVSWKPLTSMALELHPKRVKEAREDAHAKGLVGVEIADNGKVTFESRSARAAYMKAYNFYDRNAGYGDYAGRSIRPAEPPPDWHPEIVGGNQRRYRSQQEEDKAIRAEAEQIAREILGGGHGSEH